MQHHATDMYVILPSLIAVYLSQYVSFVVNELNIC